MQRRSVLLLGVCAALAVAPASARRGRGGDHDEARDARARGEALPLAKILPIALAHMPGEVLEVELERERGQLVYEIEILDRAGHVRKVILDARTGAVVRLKDDD